jgi:hypothetical protein
LGIRKLFEKIQESLDRNCCACYDDKKETAPAYPMLLEMNAACATRTGCFCLLEKGRCFYE